MTDFRIADTFTSSLARLTGEEQKAVKTTAFDLQLDPANPGMQFHKLDRARDKNFWSIRVSRDIRLIVHRSASSLLLCYVDHHDRAYAWAERRRLEIHPATGAAQLVEIREMVREVTVERYVEREPAPVARPRLFEAESDESLLSYGVPPEWLEEVRNANEDTLFELSEHLPAEAAEALLELAVGGRPVVADVRLAADDRLELLVEAGLAGAFEHPDARRRFRVVSNVEELARALEFPWEKWTVFLHPAQRETVEREYGGPARVSGTAGTGKTIVALHRAVHLTRANPDARILLTTFSEILANALRARLHRLIGNEPRIAERLEVHALDSVARRLHAVNLGDPEVAGRETIRALLEEAAAEVEGPRPGLSFLTTEWEDVVDAWGLDGWEAYRDVARLGRRTRLPESRRAALWEIFERVRAGLAARGLVTQPGLYHRLAAFYEGEGGRRRPYDFVVVDEAQDVSVAQLRFLAALGGGRANGLFFAGDLGQRIFQTPFSWKSLGVDVCGRSRTLRINYRTAYQIRAHADRLLGPEVSDVDGLVEDRRGTVSVFDGPAPVVRVLGSSDEEASDVGAWLASRVEEGVVPAEIGVFVRSEAELGRARAACDLAGLPFRVLDERMAAPAAEVTISMMHLAKGLEVRAVAVMACDDEMVPLQARIEAVADESDLEEVYETERHLLYVACTRARDPLLVTGCGAGSEFLEDLAGSA